MTELNCFFARPLYALFIGYTDPTGGVINMAIESSSDYEKLKTLCDTFNSYDYSEDLKNQNWHAEVKEILSLHVQ